MLDAMICVALVAFHLNPGNMGPVCQISTKTLGIALICFGKLRKKGYSGLKINWMGF